MRGIDLFCASQAATAVRLSMDQPSSSSSTSSSSTVYLGGGGGGGGGRAIDRHNPIIRDAKRIGKAFPLNPPCTNSQSPPIPPQPYNQIHHKGGRKTSSSKSNDQTKKSSSDSAATNQKNKKKKSTSDKQSQLGSNPRDFISPPASSRYLLGDTALSDVLSDFDPGLAMVPADVPKLKTEESSASNAQPPPSSPSPDQVVVLRVSLHCKGCEGKLRKHLSRMQGVTSFDIEFAAKKVTVVGKVTPMGVLESISKVKNAQLWTPPMSSASSVPATTSNLHSQIQKKS